MATLFFGWVGWVLSLTPPSFSHLIFNPSTNPTAPPTFKMCPESNYFSPCLPLQVQAPITFCLDNWNSCLMTLGFSPHSPLCAVMDSLKDILMCEQHKILCVFKHLFFKNQLICSLWPHTWMPSLPSVESHNASFWCLLPHSSLYLTICLFAPLHLPGNFLSEETMFTSSTPKCHLVLGRCSVNGFWLFNSLTPPL